VGALRTTMTVAVALQSVFSSSYQALLQTIHGQAKSVMVDLGGCSRTVDSGSSCEQTISAK
jgi:hypothetical protein